MQITRNTIDILKNYSEINSSLLVEEGSTLKTISMQKNILAKAVVSESFERRFAIYELPQFLNVANSSTFEGADFNFQENFVIVQKGGARSRYFYADESTIVAPQKELTMPSAEINFTLTESDFVVLKNMASVLAKPDLVVHSDGKEVLITIKDKKDAATNDFNLAIGEGNGDVYEQYFKADNLKLLKGDYDVSISQKGISYFKHKNVELEYWIALEPDSNYVGSE